MNLTNIPYFISDKLINRLESLYQKPPHAIFIDSDDTILCSLLVDRLLCALLEVPSLQNFPYLLVIEPENKSIGIEQTRQIDSFLSLTVPISSPRKVQRAVVIKDANNLTAEAQNALLKTLEEPPENSIILLSGKKNHMLPTVLSRTVILTIPTINRQDAMRHYSDYPAPEVEKMFYISKGKASLLHSLLLNDNNPELQQVRDRLELAKKLLVIPLGKRLLEVETLSKDRIEAERVIELMALLARFSAIKSLDKKALRIMDACNEALGYSKANGNMKLILDTLFMVY